MQKIAQARAVSSPAGYGGIALDDGQPRVHVFEAILLGLLAPEKVFGLRTVESLGRKQNIIRTSFAYKTLLRSTLSGRFAYKALENKDTLHIKQKILRTLCIL